MSDTTRIIIVISCLLLIGVFKSDCYEPIDGNDQLQEGSSCQFLGYDGICMKLRDCKISTNALENKGYHELKRCGFDGAQEVVCCPDLADRKPNIESTTLDIYIWSGGGGTTKSPGSDGGNNNRLNIKRKCEKMCEKIYSDNNIKPDIKTLIINGENATLGQFPHMVALGFEDSDGQIGWNCGASLLSARFVLTAAHCFVCNGCSDPVKARLGIIDINNSESAQDIDVKKSTSHPDYNPTSKHNDIGLIELVRDVQMTKMIYPACLYAEANDPSGLQIVGWGQTVSNDKTSKARFLQYAVIEPVPISECNTTVVAKNKYSSKVILETQLCATTKSDACAGDSGGPLQIKNKEGGYAIVGVVSYGVQCGTKVPGIYTRVSRYLDWVEQIVWPA